MTREGAKQAAAEKALDWLLEEKRRRVSGLEEIWPGVKLESSMGGSPVLGGGSTALGGGSTSLGGSTALGGSTLLGGSTVMGGSTVIGSIGSEEVRARR